MKSGFLGGSLALFCVLAFACESEPLAPDAAAGNAGASGDAGGGGAPDGFAGARSGDAGMSGDAGSAGAPECVDYDTPQAVGTVQNAELVEISGIAASRTQPGVLYVHNDSGDLARFFALTQAGQTLGEYALAAVTAIDWEDVAIGPGPAGDDFLFLGDIGDNAARVGSGTPRAEVYVYRVAEPIVTLNQSPVQQALNSDRLTLVYPDAPHDAETLMVDPTTSDLVIVTKENDGNSAIFRAPAAAPGGSTTTLELLGHVRFGTVQTPGNTLATSGDIAPDGHEIVIRTYGSVLLWTRPANIEIGAALGAAPRVLAPPAEAQGEAITFAADGRGWFTVAEGASSTIFLARGCGD